VPNLQTPVIPSCHKSCPSAIVSSELRSQRNHTFPLVLVLPHL
jgi:hypothetical protein